MSAYELRCLGSPFSRALSQWNLKGQGFPLQEYFEVQINNCEPEKNVGQIQRRDGGTFSK